MSANLPLLTDFHRQRRDQSLALNLIWKAAHNSTTFADFLIDALLVVGGVDYTVMLKRKAKGALRSIRFAHVGVNRLYRPYIIMAFVRRIHEIPWFQINAPLCTVV